MHAVGHQTHPASRRLVFTLRGRIAIVSCGNRILFPGGLLLRLLWEVAERVLLATPRGVAGGVGCDSVSPRERVSPVCLHLPSSPHLSSHDGRGP